MPNTPKVLIICGPTSSGKTNLALQLAKELPRANILSVDSRQVYQGLDIVTGKDIPSSSSSNIKMFGLDIFSPSRIANVGEFTRYGQKIIQDSIASDTALIIVGGTGLYLKSLTQELSSINIPPNPILRQKLEKLTLEELQKLLQQNEPQKFASLNHSDINNPRRLIRALEISATPTTSLKNISIKVSFHWIGLLPNMKTLRQKIHHRVIQRLRDGAVAEVKSLLDRYPNQSLPIFTSLGVSQIRSFLNREISEKQLIEIWTNAEYAYARRQMVWFKKQPNIVWYDKDIDKEILIKQLKPIFRENA